MLSMSKEDKTQSRSFHIVRHWQRRWMQVHITQSTNKTAKTVRTRTINMRHQYEARDVQTIIENVAHTTTNHNYNKSLTVRQ